MKRGSNFDTSFSSASATNGVIAVENPIPNDKAMNIKLFPKKLQLTL
jgi:hypothetical protein